MANKHSKDYIPTYADYEAQRTEADEWCKTHTDPRHCYDVTYDVNGTKLSEKIYAVSETEVVERLKQQCGIIGWFPRNIDVKRNYEEEK